MRARARPSSSWGFGGCLLAVFAMGCDILSGLDQARETILPSTGTYLNAPGARLATGEYGELDFIAGDGDAVIAARLSLLARSATPGDASLTVLGYTDGDLCRVPNVGTYSKIQFAAPGEPMLAYLDGPGPRGTLRFADPRCETFELAIPDASLPIGSFSGGDLVVFAGGDLLRVAVARGTTAVLGHNVSFVLRPAQGSWAVVASGKLELFAKDGSHLATLGDGVKRAGLTASLDTLFFEDDHGIHRATPTGSVVNIAPAGCRFGIPQSQPFLVVYEDPCGSGHDKLWTEGTERVFELGTDVNPRFLNIRTFVDPPKWWLLYLRDVDADEALGTLLVRDPDGEEVEVGRRAALEWAHLENDEGDVRALVDVESDTGNFVRREAHGETTLLAQRVWRSSPGPGFLANFDGVVGDFQVLVAGSAATELERVPTSQYRYADGQLRHGVTFDHYDGVRGTLTLLDDRAQPGRVLTMHALHPRHGFIDNTLPGIAWIANEHGAETGRLEYYNYELGFTGFVNEGVASFLQSSEGLLYTVSHGSSAGIWFAERK